MSRQVLTLVGQTLGMSRPRPLRGETDLEGEDLANRTKQCRGVSGTWPLGPTAKWGPLKGSSDVATPG